MKLMSIASNSYCKKVCMLKIKIREKAKQKILLEHLYIASKQNEDRGMIWNFYNEDLSPLCQGGSMYVALMWH